MGVLQRRRRRHSNTLVAAFILIWMVATAETNLVPSAEAAVATESAGGAPARRQLIGSWPPACRGSCGRCRPCKAVRVTIHPGVSVPLDYYPEAWRCKCHNRLFIP